MNQVFKGLLFKEWKMMKGFFIGQFAVTVVLFFALSFNDITVSSVELFEMMSLGVIIIPAALLFSLNTEVNQMQAFLHNPHSIHKLLTVKLFYSLFAAVSLLVVLTIIIISYALFDTAISSVLRLWITIILSSGNMLVVSIYPAVILLFLWTLHQIFRTRLGGGISLVLVVALLIASSKLLSLFGESPVYEKITHWGKVTSTSGFLLGPSYTGIYLFFALVSILLYFASTYLIERKVEA